jgi:hypothetical protein
VINVTRPHSVNEHGKVTVKSLHEKTNDLHKSLLRDVQFCREEVMKQLLKAAYAHERLL